MNDTPMTVARYTEQHQPFPVRIDGSLEAMQKLVGGYIEYVALPNGLALICNEEGLLHELTMHHAVVLDDGRYMPISGDFFVCRSEDADLVSIKGEDFVKLAELIVPGRVRT